jgi:uncharacterized protein YbjT (DUF2867 family)
MTDSCLHPQPSMLKLGNHAEPGRVTEMKNILLTGATGYIGRRLKNRLLQRPDLSIRLLVRNRNKVRPAVLPLVEIVEGDTFNEAALREALAGIDIAYYLIHSMGSGRDYEARDRLSAANFRKASIEAGVKRLVYLGGLGVRETASRHLLSRIETGEILSAEPERLQTVWFRAGVIIGSGSASFEIIRHLVEKLPIMITPKWVKTATQPIAVDDVLSYLEAGIDLDYEKNLEVDIGAECMSFREMMLTAAEVMGLKRILIPVPVLTPALSSYWLLLITTVPYSIAAALIEGLKSETVALNDNAARYFSHIKPLPYREAVRRALAEMEDDAVLSRWCDSSAAAACDILHQDDAHTAVLRDRRIIPLHGLPAVAVFQSVKALGGRSGWFSYHFLWQFRGFLDKIFGGYGMSRGRRSQKELRIGDGLDFWKVADIKENRRLLLLAQMKLPGKAWLEFDIQPDQLVQTAHFLPRGLTGRLYWYAVLPLHNLVFQDLARKVVDRARHIAEHENIS